MTRNNFFTLLLVFVASLAGAQEKSSSNGALMTTKQKIENTVPVLKQYFQNKANQYEEQGGVASALATLEKQYNHVAKEYDMYLYNMSSCLLLSSSKGSEKCMDRNNTYLTKTLGVYDTYINYVTQEKGKVAEDVLNQVKFDAADLVGKIDTEYSANSGALKKMKSADRKNSADNISSGAYKMKRFNEF